jgi:Kef-type K+ transport system membrane component KefB
VLFLAVRGVPTFLAHRRALGDRDALALGFMSASALPLLVVITTVAVSAGVLPAANAAALVMAGTVSVMVYPMVAERLRTGVQIPGGAQHTKERKPDAL